MTIICYDGETIAADRQVTSDKTIVSFEKKIAKWDKGWYSVAGSECNEEPFTKWLIDREKFKPVGNFFAIYTEDKNVRLLDRSLVPYKAYVPWAIGSCDESIGAAIALMRIGYSAKQTCQEMCKYDITCGGKIDVVYV